MILDRQSAAFLPFSKVLPMHLLAAISFVALMKVFDCLASEQSQMDVTLQLLTSGFEFRLFDHPSSCVSCHSRFLKTTFVSPFVGLCFAGFEDVSNCSTRVW